MDEKLIKKGVSFLSKPGIRSQPPEVFRFDSLINLHPVFCLQRLHHFLATKGRMSEIEIKEALRRAGFPDQISKSAPDTASAEPGSEVLSSRVVTGSGQASSESAAQSNGHRKTTARMPSTLELFCASCLVMVGRENKAKRLEKRGSVLAREKSDHLDIS